MYKHSEKTKQKIRLSRIGYKFSDEAKEKMRLAKLGKPSPMKGKHHTKKAILKNSLAHTGKNHPNWGKHLSEKTRFLIGDAQKGEKNWNWQGDYPKYWAVHKYIIRHYGQPDTCEHCGKSGLKGQRINWANKDNNYKRDINEWLRLCVRCHREYDVEHNLTHY